MPVDVRYKGNPEKVQEALESAVQSTLEKALGEIVRKAKANIENESRNTRRPNDKRPRLSESIRSEPVKRTADGTGFTGAVRATAPHAAAQEYGSGKHREDSDDILGLPVPPASPGTTSSGYAIPARRATGTYPHSRNHPGVPGKQYMRKAIKDVLDNRFAEILDQELRTMLDAKGVRATQSTPDIKPRVSK